MKKIIKTAVLVFFGSLIVTGCYYDNEEELYPAAESCDTVDVTYSGDILAMVDQYCQTCHSGNTPSGNLNLETFGQITAAAEKMYERISKPAGDVQLMPPGQKLDDCTIKKMKVWIENGKPNN